MVNAGLVLFILVLFSIHFCRIVDFSGIWTRIVGVEGEHSNHLTTTTTSAQFSGIFISPLWNTLPFSFLLPVKLPIAMYLLQSCHVLHQQNIYLTALKHATLFLFRWRRRGRCPHADGQPAVRHLWHVYDLVSYVHMHLKASYWGIFFIP